MMGTAAIYARVSTKQQRDEGGSLASQTEACAALARDKGYEVPSDWEFQEDWPGSELARPQLDRARDLVRQHCISALIVYSTDRLSRNPIHLAVIAEECQKHDTELIFVTEPLDTSPEGMLIAYVKGYAAQIERVKIEDRTTRGKSDRARAGKLPQGTGRGIYGYRYDRDTGKRTVVEIEANVVRHIFQLAIEGRGAHQIAQVLNSQGVPSFGGRRWHSQVVRFMLHNSAYAGITYFGKTRRIALEGRRRKLTPRKEGEWLEIPNATPAIITLGEFRQAQAALAMPKRVCRPATCYLLTGHIVCGLCGGPMSGSMLGGRYRYYDCRRRWDRQEGRRNCAARYTRAESLEERVFEQLRNVIEKPEVVLAAIRGTKSDGAGAHIDREIGRIEAEIRRTKVWEQRMVRLYGYGEIDDDFILRESRRAKARRLELEREHDSLVLRKQEIERLDVAEDRAAEYCRRVKERVGELGHQEKRLLLEALQIKVVVFPQQIEVQGAIPTYATIEQTSA